MIKFPLFVFASLFLASLLARRLWPEDPASSVGHDVMLSLIFAALMSLLNLRLRRRQSKLDNERPAAPTGEPTPHRY